MITTNEIQLLLTIHSGPLSKEGRHGWYSDVSRNVADRLLEMKLITREDDLKDERYCYYEVTPKARDYITFIQEVLDDTEEGPVQPEGSDVEERSHKDSHEMVGAQ